MKVVSIAIEEEQSYKSYKLNSGEHINKKDFQKKINNNTIIIIIISNQNLKNKKYYLLNNNIAM